MEHHSYIFVRQDLSPEQQLIQFAHVSCVLGRNLPADICPHSLNFVGVGVPNEEALYAALDLMDRESIKSHLFVEPDIGNQLTAIASIPLTGDARRAFKRYKTLRFGA